MDYADWTADDLLEALDLAGRKPDPDLLRACLSRREEITPGLLDMLREGPNENWAEDDPRGYRDIHAGLLLVEFQEEKALPIFDEIFRDEERQDALWEWFDGQFPKYGAVAIPWMTGLARDAGAPRFSRTMALAMLAKIAELFPEERPRVLEVIRAVLPPFQEDGTLVLPGDPDNISYAHVELWTWAIDSLMDLRDQDSRPQVLALFDEDLVDTWIVGDKNAYLDAIEGRADDLTGPDPVDLIDYYEGVSAEGEEEDWPDLDELPPEMLEDLDRQIAELKAVTGLSDEQLASMMMDVATGKIQPEFDESDPEDEPPSYPTPITQAHLPMPFHAEKAPGRNDPCPCGSGKKYKKCHGKGG